MRTTLASPAVLALVTVLAPPIGHCAPAALAQTQGTPPAEPGASALAGPSVAAPPPGAGLVEREYTGVVRRLEIPPEEAAIARLDLDAPTRERVERVLTTRIRTLDRIVVRNLNLLIQIGTASAAGDQLDTVNLLHSFHLRLQPVRDLGPLEAQLRAALPPPQQAEFDRLVNEYWDAIVAERVGTDVGLRALAKRWQVLAEENLAIFFREIERSYARASMDEAGAQLEIVLALLELSPEQETRIRGAIRDYLAGRDEPPEDPGPLFLIVFAHLNLAQQQRLVELATQQ